MLEREFSSLEVYMIGGLEHEFKNGKLEAHGDFLVIFDCENEKEIEYVIKLDLINMFKITKKLKDINQ